MNFQTGAVVFIVAVSVWQIAYGFGRDAGKEDSFSFIMRLDGYMGEECYREMNQALRELSRDVALSGE